MRSSLGSWLLVTIEESSSAGSRSPRFSRRLKISAVLLFRLPCRRPGEKVCPGWNVIPISHYSLLGLQNPYWLILSAKILLVNGRSTTADSTGINRLPQAQARPARAAARANRRCIPSPRWQDGARIEPQETDRRSLRRGATSKPASKAAEVWN